MSFVWGGTDCKQGDTKSPGRDAKQPGTALLWAKPPRKQTDNQERAVVFRSNNVARKQIQSNQGQKRLHE